MTFVLFLGATSLQVICFSFYATSMGFRQDNMHFVTNMMASRQCLPATEALNRDMQEHGMPRPYGQRQITPSPPKEHDEPQKRKRSFDMSNLQSATEPLEEAFISFPKIEWTMDEECEVDADHHVDEIPDLKNDDDRFYSSHSLPSLGERTRAFHKSLVRSKSLKSSLCFLAERSVSRRQSGVSAKEGSWGYFVCDDGEEEEEPPFRMTSSDHALEELKRRKSGTDQANIHPFPFLIYCATNTIGLG